MALYTEQLLDVVVLDVMLESGCECQLAHTCAVDSALCSHSPADNAGGTTGWRQSFSLSSNSFLLHSSLGSEK